MPFPTHEKKKEKKASDAAFAFWQMESVLIVFGFFIFFPGNSVVAGGRESSSFYPRRYRGAI